MPSEQKQSIRKVTTHSVQLVYDAAGTLQDTPPTEISSNSRIDCVLITPMSEPWRIKSLLIIDDEDRKMVASVLNYSAPTGNHQTWYRH